MRDGVCVNARSALRDTCLRAPLARKTGNNGPRLFWWAEKKTKKKKKKKQWESRGFAKLRDLKIRDANLLWTCYFLLGLLALMMVDYHKRTLVNAQMNVKHKAEQVIPRGCLDSQTPSASMPVSSCHLLSTEIQLRDNMAEHQMCSRPGICILHLASSFIWQNTGQGGLLGVWQEVCWQLLCGPNRYYNAVGHWLEKWLFFYFSCVHSLPDLDLQSNS